MHVVPEKQKVKAVIVIVMCAVAVAVIGQIFPLSDYWEFITVVIVVLLAMMG